jgi:hypothetical protein
MLEAILKDGMTKQAENQTPKLGRAQDLNWVRWQSKDNFNMILENECFEISKHGIFRTMKFVKNSFLSMKIFEMFS